MRARFKVRDALDATSLACCHAKDLQSDLYGEAPVGRPRRCTRRSKHVGIDRRSGTDCQPPAHGELGTQAERL